VLTALVEQQPHSSDAPLRGESDKCDRGPGKKSFPQTVESDPATCNANPARLLTAAEKDVFSRVNVQACNIYIPDFKRYQSPISKHLMIGFARQFSSYLVAQSRRQRKAK